MLPLSPYLIEDVCPAPADTFSPFSTGSFQPRPPTFGSTKSPLHLLHKQDLSTQLLSGQILYSSTFLTLVRASRR